MRSDRERLHDLIQIYAGLAETSTGPERSEHARTYALLVIARELYGIEGSLDTLAINTPP